ncbi:MAG: hypothetical protein KKH98_05750 [Spirochaetes bacterium]|nr:hypothetical protein [Spirochaetota bacterium]
MNLSDVVIKFIARHFDLDSLQQRWEATKNLGKSKDLDIPSELLRLNIDILSRSFYNINAIQPHLDWVLPYWILRQYDPEDVSFLPSSYLSINLTHRNWTGISSLASDHEAIIDQRALLTPLFDGWSVDFWIKKDDYVIVPSKLEEMNQHLVHRSPIVKSTFYKKSLQITSEALMHNETGENFIMQNFLVENMENTPLTISFYISIRPFNPESVVPVFSIEYNKKRNAFKVNNRDFLYLADTPERVICSSKSPGDAYFFINNAKVKSITRSEDQGGLCTCFAEYKVRLKAGGSFSTNIIIPIANNDLKKVNKIFKEKYHAVKNRNIQLWQDYKKESLSLTTPDSKINEAFESFKNNILILVDKEAIPPGPFTYHNMWFRDAAYSITSLLKLGFFSDVKRILKAYFKRQQKDGYFLSQHGEWDANGQVLWTIMQYCRFTDDLEFADHHYQSLLKAVLWVFRQRQKTKKNKSDLHYGLLPSGFSAEHFGPSNYYYWDNYWSYAGIRDFISISKILKKKTESIEKENEEYKNDIERSIKKFQKINASEYIPSSPYRKKDSSIIGSVAALYPLQVMDPDREDVTNTLKIIRKNFMQKGAFFHKLLHSGYNVYLTAQVAQCYLMRGSTMALPLLDWILDHATDTYTFPEAIHPETKGGCMGDGHHGWAISELIHLMRNMIFYEKDDSLIFFPVIPHHWLDMGSRLELKNAYSHFGKFHLSLAASSQFIEFDFQADFFKKPKKIRINFPVQIEKIIINNNEKIIKEKSFIITYSEQIHIKIYI